MDAAGPTAIREAYAYWHGLINFEQRAPAPGDFKLDRMRALLAKLGNPHKRLRILHVAGSKGKGSISAMLAAILRAAGYRTGLFTSPHLISVEERFQVDGTPISPPELATLLLEVRDAAAGLVPTFFEVATTAGFLHFVRRRVEASVLEVGLGGRFDSTNVCDPAVAIIASISYDHTRLLGDRLASIAFEKAGIIKTGRTTVSGATAAEPRTVIERMAQLRRSPLVQLGVDFRFGYQPGWVEDDGLKRPRVRIATHRQIWPEMELNLLGEHQAANAAVAVTAIDELRRLGWRISDRAVREGLAEVRWPARLEVFGRRPHVVLDCAHNIASAEALVDTLQSTFPPGRRLLIFAGSNDKDLAGMFRAIAPHFQHVLLTRFTQNPRAVPPAELLNLLRVTSAVPATACATPAEALQVAHGLAGPNDLIVITGSVFLAGEMRSLLVDSAG